MDLSAFQAAVLDMDGVITQTAKVHARAWKRMFDEYLERRGEQTGEAYEPFDIDDDYRRYVDGKPRYDGVRSFLDSRGIEIPVGDPNDPPEKETVCGLGNRKNRLFHELLEDDGVEVWDDAIEQVRNWKQAGWKVAVFSSSRNCEAVLRAAGVLDLFDAKVDGNDLDRLELPGKPAPDMLLHAAQELGVEPSQAIVVEDAIAGVQAGRAGRFGLVVGVARHREATEDLCIGLVIPCRENHHAHTKDLWRAGAQCVVHDLRQLTTASHCSRSDDRPPDALHGLGDSRGRNAPSLYKDSSSAMEHLPWIASRIQGKELALFLDYDGTLTPIVRRPEEATLSDDMRSLLSELAQRCTVAIVSGRDRGNVEEMVGVNNLVYAGSHGFDIRGPGGLEMQQKDAKRALPDLDEAEGQLRRRIEPTDGAHVERKKFAIAVHYREVGSEDRVRQVESAVDEVLGAHPKLRKRGGKKVFELQPDVDWDKGRAVAWLTRSLGLDHSDVVVIYVGDDLTDEDAFLMLRGRPTGIGIRVAPPPTGTHASHSLRDCDEVRRFLQSLLDILKQKREANQSGTAC